MSEIIFSSKSTFTVYIVRHTSKTRKYCLIQARLQVVIKVYLLDKILYQNLCVGKLYLFLTLPNI